MSSVRRPLLVTGGAGYIGAHFVAMLEDLGLPYVVLDNLCRSSGDFVRRDRLVIGDIADADLVVQLCRDQEIRTVVHFAAFAYVGESVRDPEIYYQNNVAKSVQFLSALRRAGVANVVFSSSCATYGDPPNQRPISEDVPQSPINPYGRTKLFLEQILLDYERAYGIRTAILRYFNAAGSNQKHAIPECHTPETHVIPLALQAAAGGDPFTIFGDDFPTPDGTCVRDFVHVDDLASAHLLAVQHLENHGVGMQLNLGTGTGVSVREVLSAVARVTGKPVPSRVGPRREGDPPILVADVRRAVTLLGWTAKHREIDEIIRTAHDALASASLMNAVR
ncbi:MAG: UDP-glucose 4-epimerase GalE [Vulcanimicrobiaceae bacterium]